MSSSQADTSELQDKLKSSLWFSIGRLIDSECARLSSLQTPSSNTTITCTPQFKGSLTELVWTQIENIATDLETFSRHAGRTTILPEDVLLVCRRNEALRGIIEGYMQEQEKGEKGQDGAVVKKARARPKKAPVVE